MFLLLFGCASNQNVNRQSSRDDWVVYFDEDEPGEKKQSKPKQTSPEASTLKKSNSENQEEVRDFKKSDGIVYLDYEDQNNEIPGKPFKPNHHSKKGKASFYADKFHGRKTASGELYNKNKLTAAHPKLKFGTMVRVTNLFNDRSVVVRVNDRGPYAKSRIIDLSFAAAQKLDMIKNGVVEVLVEVINND
ncbi:MAG: septal ring lytic transglycosylase RlpA family protein [Bacteroidales bacterium]|nr:septal ring lytic transglycosylase RlpA family protein [Bacteroidales bacterium]